MVLHTGDLRNTFLTQQKISLKWAVQFIMVYIKMLPFSPITTSHPPLKVHYLETGIKRKEFYFLGNNINRKKLFFFVFAAVFWQSQILKINVEEKY